MPRPTPKPMRQIRREKDVTQRVLARALGVSVAAVSDWERGRREPGVGAARQIAALLGVSLDAILFPAELRRAVRRQNGRAEKR